MTDWSAQIDKWGRVTELEVDGIPMAPPAGMQVVAIPGQPPQLTLYVAETVNVAGDSDIIREQAGSPRGAVLAWLDTIDPEMLEKKALEGMGMFGAQTYAQAFLGVLRAEASELP